jgi:long-chain acyl-CoA synthetase
MRNCPVDQRQMAGLAPTLCVFLVARPNATPIGRKCQSMVRKHLILLLLLLAQPALPAELAGIRLDERITLSGQELVLNGAGLRSVLFLKVYVGSLYLPTKCRDFSAVVAQFPRRVQLNMLRDLSSDRIVGALIDGLNEGNDATTLIALKNERDQFIDILKNSGDVKEGTVVTFDFVDGYTRIGVNGIINGSVRGEAFNRALISVWIGNRVEPNSVKNGMLGN